MGDTKERFSTVTVALHWIVGLTIIGMLALGIYMSQTHNYGLYSVHKSIGISIFLIIIARVIWRIRNGWPEPVGQYKKIEHLLAKIVHYILLIGSVLIPLSGMTMGIAGGRGLKVFGFELVSPNYSDADPEKTMAINKALADLCEQIHWMVSYLLIAALMLHIVGALKHHFIDKGGTIRRMLGRDIG